MNLVAERLFKYVGIFAAIGLSLFLAYTFSTLVVYAIVALIISYILDPYVNSMQANGMPRTWAIVVALSILVLLLIWFSTTIFPTIINQILALTKDLSVANVQEVAGRVERKLLDIIPFLPDGFLRNILVGLFEKVFEVGGIQSTLSGVFSVFTNVFSAAIVIPFSTFFFLKDGHFFRRNLLKLVPNKYFEITQSIVSKIETRLGYYLKGVGVESIIVGVVAWVLLVIIGMKNALAVAVVIGVANSIPYFGPAIGYVLAAVVALFESGNFVLAGNTLLVNLTLQMLDNILLKPIIFSKSADLHPLTILFAVLIGAEAAGIIGMLVAIPIATIVRIMYKEISWSLEHFYIFKKNNA